MVTVHIHIQEISRGKGRSATSAAAYRSATRIENTRERRRMREPLRHDLELEPKGARRRLLRDIHPPLPGRVNDFRAKQGVLRQKIKLPPNAPEEYLDRPVLWNEAEDSEPRCNSVVAREADMALPCELNLDQNWEIAEAIADWFIDRYGVGTDICIHRAAEGHDPRNTHLHIMWTVRVLDEDGFGKKTRVLDSFKTREAEFFAIRKCYEDCVNAGYAKAGMDHRIDVRSYKDQGIDRIPQIHAGVACTAMADRGEKPESRERIDSKGRVTDWEKIDHGLTRAEHNANVVKLNERVEQHGNVPLHVQIKNIDQYLTLLIKKYADIEALVPASMLPLWVQALIEKYRLKARDLYESFIQAKREEEDRQEERRREGIHAKMKRIEKEIEELERAKERRQALQRLYTKIEAYVAMRPSLVVPIERPPTRILSDEQYRVELVAKAEMARARVPPEYRPRMAVKDVIWDSVDDRHDEGSLGSHFHTGPPADNGGLVEPPPPVTPAFNEMANPSPEKPYKQKVSIGFGL